MSNLPCICCTRARGSASHISCCHMPCCRCHAAGEVNSEYTRQRNYLEKTIDSLKRKLAADSEAHRADELRIMSQNVSLIRELNELRREIKVCQRQQQVACCRNAPCWQL